MLKLYFNRQNSCSSERKTETAGILNFAKGGQAGEAEHGPTIEIPKKKKKKLKVAKTAEKRKTYCKFPIKNQLTAVDFPKVIALSCEEAECFKV